MGRHALVGISVWRSLSHFPQDDHTCGAAVDAECTSSAHVVVDEEDRVVTGILTGQLGTERLVDRIGANQVDALPWADVDATLTGDALGLIDVNELLRLDSL
jgi:hypothetical protein